MINFVYYDAFGKILSVRSQKLMSATFTETSVERCLPVEQRIDPNNYYVSEDQLVQISEAPSSNHAFDYATKTWVDSRTATTQWLFIRDWRNKLLTQSDWTQLPDVAAATQNAWATYRQALRDITLQTDPFAIVWPISP